LRSVMSSIWAISTRGVPSEWRNSEAETSTDRGAPAGRLSDGDQAADST
jgi:hypothetical protein